MVSLAAYRSRRLPGTILRLAAVSALAASAAACGSLDRLSNVGKAPNLSAIEDPTSQPGYKPVQMPMPTPEPVSYASNSLWRQGSRAFFKDQRARLIGDLVTVKVKVTDKANIANATKRARTGSEAMSNTNNFGFESDYNKIFPDAVDPKNLFNQKTDSSVGGSGSVQRSEELTTNVAAVVTQSLPNGNLVIEGKQEIRVNFEIRELIVAGVIRPEDIESDNTIDSSKIAQARIAYGGRGQITDVQQPRYGTQVMDILLPF
jgi:flagellar L-ring protein FlgH